jgi:Domain of unknown function (DUF1906)
VYIIDTPTNLQNYAKRMKAAGVSTAFRYESRLPNAGWKRWQPDEMKAFQDAGLHCAIVYEDDGHPGGHSDGVEAATYALERCAARGQPDGTAIYYAVDFDASINDVNGKIVQYFHGVNEMHAKYRPKIRIGCYGSGMVVNTLQAIKLIDLRWITCSLGFNGSRAAVRNQRYDGWQSQCDTHLLGVDVDLNTFRIDNYGQFAPWGTIDFTPEPRSLAALTESPPSAFDRGKGSVYSQFHGTYNWVDDGDSPGSNALGVPDYCQGVSFYEHATLGKWFEVFAPNDHSLLLQQTDIGPAPWTGRKIDIASVSAERFGYSPSSFPTDGIFAWRRADPPPQVASLSPRQQAIRWLQIRQEETS